MDSNVSKTTFFYKFIKLQLNQKSGTIENLLKQSLLRTIDLLSQRRNLDIDLSMIANQLDRKLILLHNSDRLTSFSNNCPAQIDSKLPYTHFTYRCAIAFSLANYYQLSPQDIARELIEILGELQSNLTSASGEELAIIAHTSGYIDFYLSETFLALWLKQLPDLLLNKSISSAVYAPIVIEAPRNSLNLVPLQYVHTRCCSLLDLAARQKLIVLKDPHFEYLTWHIARPQPISWLDTQNRLWLSDRAEYNLLWQLLKAVDTSTSNSDHRYRLAKKLCEAMLIFDAECRILGEVAQKIPQKALARLGLVALVQYWLQQLLCLELKF